MSRQRWLPAVPSAWVTCHLLAPPCPGYLPRTIGLAPGRSYLSISKAGACSAPGKLGRSGQGLPGPLLSTPLATPGTPRADWPHGGPCPCPPPRSPHPMAFPGSAPEGEAGRGAPAAPLPSPDGARRVRRPRPELDRTLPEAHNLLPKAPPAGPQDWDPAHLLGVRAGHHLDADS